VLGAAVQHSGPTPRSSGTGGALGVLDALVAPIAVAGAGVGALHGRNGVGDAGLDGRATGAVVIGGALRADPIRAEEPRVATASGKVR